MPPNRHVHETNLPHIVVLPTFVRWAFPRRIGQLQKLRIFGLNLRSYTKYLSWMVVLSFVVT